MKTKFYILLFILFSATSCDMVLEKQPLDITSDEAVWRDPILIKKYLQNCYAQLKFYNEMQLEASHWGYSTADITITATNIADEATSYWFQTPKSHWISIAGGQFEYWNYPVIRDLNIFIEKMETAQIDPFVRIQRLSEARFLRAFAYFNMVKRYGGVPLILKVQTTDDPYEVLYPKRDKEEKIYQFIIDEMNDIINNKRIADQYSDSDRGRPTIWAVAALKSRAAMYAASIATWGTVEKDGLVGIDQSKASYFWQQSLDASNYILTKGPFALYKAHLPADPAKNYRNIFLDENNSEVIFSEIFDGYSGKGHSWDHWQNPRGYNSWGGGQGSCVYLEMVESYENTDGSNPKLDRDKISSGHLWTVEELYGKKDPRFKASIYTQDSPWSHNGESVVLDYHNGVRKPDGTIITSGAYNGIQAIGFCQQNPWPTPFGVLKYLDEPAAMIPDRGYSDTDWIVFRLAEIYINKAEAAFELNDEPAARAAINEVRIRAGLNPYTTPITREQIRNERKIELAFEGNRYFDVRRWRTAVKDLTNAWHGLRYVLDAETMKYQISIIENIAGIPAPYFDKKHYYLPISQSRTAANPNLVENPDYK